MIGITRKLHQGGDALKENDNPYSPGDWSNPQIRMTREAKPKSKTPPQPLDDNFAYFFIEARPLFHEELTRINSCYQEIIEGNPKDTPNYGNNKKADVHQLASGLFTMS